MGKRRPGVSEDLMSNTAEEWKTMLAAPEVVSVKREHKYHPPPIPKKMLIPLSAIVQCAVRRFKLAFWSVMSSPVGPDPVIS